MSLRARLRPPGAAPLVCGHRGAAADAPENTMASFAAALDVGAGAVELDVHLSADGIPMVIHDATLERTTDARGPVGERTAAELARLDAGSWRGARWRGERIPRLDDVLALCRGRALVLCEVKDDAGEHPLAWAAVASAAERTGTRKDALLLAFDHRHLVAARAGAPWLTRVANVDTPVTDPAGMLDALGAAALSCAHELVDAGLAAGVHGAGAALLVWTVDDPAEAVRLAALGIDSVISNRPAAILAAFGAI